MTVEPLPITPVGDGVASLSVALSDPPYLSPEFVERLTASVALLRTQTSVRALVLEGGHLYFCAGASRESLLDQDTRIGVTTYTARLPRDLLSLPVPTVAAMAGHAIGGGLVLGLWCDIALLAEESLYGANFMALGFTPGMGATVVLEEALGAPLARELLFSGRLLKGRELRQSGGPLAHAVVPRTEVRDRAFAIAREIAAAPRESLVLLKRSLAARRRLRLESALQEEHANHAELFAGPDTFRTIARRYGGPGADVPETNG